MSRDKDLALKKIAVLCKKNTPPEFNKVSDFQGGVFDNVNYVSPWSIGAHNSDANLMLVAQDWASSKFLLDPQNLQYAKYGRNPTLATNKNIDEYLKLFGLVFSDTYATNAFAYVKTGSMSAGIKPSSLRASIEQNLLPQIAIIQPKMIICIGSMVFNELRLCAGLSRVSISKGHAEPFQYKGTKIYGAHHTGGLGTANAGGKSSALLQWKALAQEYRKLF